MAVNIKLTKQQQQIIAVAVLFIGGGGFAYVKYFWLPVSQKISDTKAAIEATEAKIAKAKNQAVRLEKIKKELAELNERALEDEKRLPRTVDLPAVIDTVSSLTRRYNFSLASFSAGVAKPQAHFIETVYSVSGKATYHDLGRFLAAIAIEERIFNVRNIVYGTPDGAGVMTIQFQLVSYQYKG